MRNKKGVTVQVVFYRRDAEKQRRHRNKVTIAVISQNFTQSE
ncbi:MAG: hypothetical protein AB1422_03020 [bacterium]